MWLKKRWGKTSPTQRADELYEYAALHIADKRDAKIELGKRELYRIFYYDCPPVENGSAYHPLLKKTIHFTSKDASYKWNKTFMKELGEKRKVALRLGQLITENAKYNLKPWVTRKLMDEKISLVDLKKHDFDVNFKQSGVDMRIGLDIASMAYEGIVNQIILISGDVDFVPAAKVARRRGIDFIVDSMGEHIRDDLKLHADGVVTVIDDMDKVKRKRNKE